MNTTNNPLIHNQFSMYITLPMEITHTHTPLYKLAIDSYSCNYCQSQIYSCPRIILQEISALPSPSSHSGMKHLLK